MNSKFFWLTILGIIISFFGGFYLANSLNGNELLRLQAENEQLKKGVSQNPQGNTDSTLTEAEIRQRIAEADQNPTDLSFQKNLGLALLSYGMMKQNTELISESARILQRAYDGNQNDLDVTVALGNAFYDIASLKQNDSENFFKARGYYAKALEQKPNDASVRADYGSTYIFAKPPDFEKGVAELDKALQLEPKNQRALLLMTQSLIKQNKQTEAEKYLARLKELNPQTPSIAELTARVTQEDNTQK